MKGEFKLILEIPTVAVKISITHFWASRVNKIKCYDSFLLRSNSIKIKNAARHSFWTPQVRWNVSIESKISKTAFLGIAGVFKIKMIKMFKTAFLGIPEAFELNQKFEIAFLGITDVFDKTHFLGIMWAFNSIMPVNRKVGSF